MMFMIWIGNSIRNFGAWLISEALRINPTLNSIDLRGLKELIIRIWIKNKKIQ